jgi:hypothetical protein
MFLASKLDWRKPAAPGHREWHIHSDLLNCGGVGSPHLAAALTPDVAAYGENGLA